MGKTGKFAGSFSGKSQNGEKYLYNLKYCCLMYGISLGNIAASSPAYYPEEDYTYGDAAVLLGVSSSEVKELTRNSRLKTIKDKIKGWEIARYLVNHRG